MRSAGRVLTGVIALLLLVDVTGKLLELPPVIEGTVQLGYSEKVVFGLGLLELVCVVAYVLPHTAVPGAILLTGYLGGAVATHVRLGHPWLTHSLFPLYVGACVWGGLLLRDERLRALFRRRA